MTVSGLDFSHYQGAINWAAVKGSGASFAIGKVSEGLTPDPTWQANRAAALAAGITVGGYHWAHPNTDPTACARAFAAAYQPVAGMMLAWLDIEHNGNPTTNPTAAGGRTPAQVHDWVHAFAAAYAAPLGIYTGAWFWTAYVAASGCQQCAQRPLWLSRYAPTMGAVPAPWKSAAIWQYTETGSNPGVAGAVDLDRLVEPTTLASLVPAPPGTSTTGSDDMSAADVTAINAHTDRAFTILRTDTTLGTSIANVRAHQDSQGNQLQALQADVDKLKADIAAIRAAVVKG